MIKTISSLENIIYRSDWCNQLQQVWHDHIPISRKIGVKIQQYTGEKIVTTIPVVGNQNLHKTLFAGSLFSLATLTGWGLIWLILRERNLTGTIILADAHIRYKSPIKGKPVAVAEFSSLIGDLNRLSRGCKARVQIQVKLFGDNTNGVLFNGVYIIEPIGNPNYYKNKKIIKKKRSDFDI